MSEDDNSEEEVDLRKRVEEIYGNTLSPDTKKTYSSYLRVTAEFLSEKHPDQLNEDGTINFEELTIAAFEEFLAEKLVKKRSYSTLSVPLLFLHSGYRSAIQWGYKLANVDYPPEYSALKDFYRGSKREIATDKLNGVRNAKEGKDPLPFGVYEWLCSYFISKGDLFSWCYLTLSWNLCCRTGNTASIANTHIKVGASDSVLFYLPKTKNDQAGDFGADPLHVYANPNNPTICPILALGIYLITTGGLSSDGKLFPGGNQDSRFLDHLGKAFETEEGKAQLAAHGLEKSDIGSHSSRKGPVTYAAAGITDAPPIVSLLRRGRWQVGNGTLDRYFKPEAGGDEYCGRVVAGLDISSHNFGVLPPHFPPNFITADEFDLALVFPKADDSLTPAILWRTLASVAYHREFLLKSLPKRDKFRASTLFSNPTLLNNLVDIVVSGLTSPHMTATGIPQWVNVMRTIESRSDGLEALLGTLLTEIRAISPNLADNIGRILEENGAAAANITPNRIQEVIENCLNKSLASRFPAGITDDLNGRDDEPEQNDVQDIAHGQSGVAKIHTWQNGNVSICPEDFDFPIKADLFTAWRVWHMGIPADGIPALRLMGPKDMSTKKKRHDYSEYKCLALAIIESLGEDYTFPTLEPSLSSELNLGIERLFGPNMENLRKKYTTRPKQWSLFTAMKEVRALKRNDDTGAARVAVRVRKARVRRIEVVQAEVEDEGAMDIDG